MAKVSVIIPIYKVEKYLSRCLDSVVNQTLEDIEIVLVDDGSPDSCPEICDRYAKKDSRIKVIHKKNEGLGYARNSGMLIATGEYIAFLDSDDYVSKDMYEKVYSELKRTDADCCVTGYVVKKDSGDEIRKENPLGTAVYKNDDIIIKVLAGMLGSKPNQARDTDVGMSVWKCVYRKELLQEKGILFPSERESISEDIIFQIRVLPQVKRVCTLSEGMYYYCENSNSQSLTKTYSKDKFDRYKKLYNVELEMLSKIKFCEETRLRATRMFLGNTRVCIKQICQSTENSKQEKKTLLQAICDDKEIQDVLKWYPWKDNPLRQKIVTLLIKKKCVRLIMWLV